MIDTEWSARQRMMKKNTRWDYAHGDEHALVVVDVKAHLVMRRKNGPWHGALMCLRKDFGTPNTLYTNCSKRKPRDSNLVQGYGVFGTGFGKGSSVQKWLRSRVAEGNMFTKLKKQIINALISVFLFIRVLLSMPYACGLNYP